MCTTRSQIEIVLTIYASHIESPLPSNDEILFCHSQTTSEEVENFLRIAYKSTGDKIYTLANIQDINYENTIQIERFMSTNHSVIQTSTYRLVFVCCVDKHEHQQQQSILPSLLIRNKVNTISLTTSQLEHYLMSKLLTQDETSLGRFDMSHSTCRTLLSCQAGNGKSTFVNFFKDTVKDDNFELKLFRIKTESVNLDDEAQKLLDYCENQNNAKKTLFHIDISNEVIYNVENFLFNMLVLSYLKHSNGSVWRRSNKDYFLIEMMSPCFANSKQTNNTATQGRPIWFHSILNFLPKIEFRTPSRYLYDLINSDEITRVIYLHDNLFNNFYKDILFQRTAFYLRMFKENPAQLSTFRFSRVPRNNLLTQSECLQILLNV